jgi:hypothetical protein
MDAIHKRPLNHRTQFLHDLSYPSFLDNYEEPSIIPGEESETEMERHEFEPPRIEIGDVKYTSVGWHLRIWVLEKCPY